MNPYVYAGDNPVNYVDMSGQYYITLGPRAENETAILLGAGFTVASAIEGVTGVGAPARS